MRNQNAIKTQLAFLEKKVRLMALIELVFSTHAHERIISFSRIAQACELMIDEVELVLMRAFSLELIKGTIDEIDQTVNVTYVIPRTLNPKQVKELESKTEFWINNVEKMNKQFAIDLKEKVEAMTT